MAKKTFTYGAIGFALGSLFGLLFFGMGFLIIGACVALIGGGLGYRTDLHGDVLSRIDAIRSKLRGAQTDKKQIIESRRLVDQWLKEKMQSRAEISNETVNAISSIVTAYVDQTPNLMEAIFRSCKWSNLENEVIILLRKTCLAYFESEGGPLDNSSGIAGYLDDAYATQLLIEKVASWHGATLASSIEGSVDLREGNAFVARLLPPNIVLEVTSKVEEALNASQTRQMLARIALQSAALQGNWSRASNHMDFKKGIVKDQIYSDLAKDGIYMRPTE
jgi:hypothetical protein